MKNTQKIQYLTKAERSQFILTTEQKDILFGLLLGDLNATKQGGSVNAKLCFAQGLVHEAYLLHLYELFSSYCRSGPKTFNRLPDKRTGKVYSYIYFNTYSLPCFTDLYHLFYPAGIKVLPLNICVLLTPLGLAYWIADDGSFDKSSQRLTLNTQSFILTEVELLAKTLKDKWDLKCAIYKDKNGYKIVILRKSLPILQHLFVRYRTKRHCAINDASQNWTLNFSSQTEN